MRPNGTKTWLIEYEFRARRRKYTLGVFDGEGALGDSLTAWLTYGRLHSPKREPLRVSGNLTAGRDATQLPNGRRRTADPVTVAALRLLILTGQREREVTDAEWNEFDLEAGIWKIPAIRTKARRTHVVHLAPQAVSILSTLRATRGNDRYVFASPLRHGKPIYGRSVNNALLLMFKRCKLPGVTHCHVHHLRRTLITRLPDLGFEPFIGHKIANHVLPGVLAHYNHNDYLERRKEALLAWAQRIEALAVSTNVVQLRRAAA